MVLVGLGEAFWRTDGGGVCATAVEMLKKDSFCSLGFLGKLVKMGVRVDLSIFG